jgi:DNA-binding Xre family transcriptional regulator
MFKPINLAKSLRVAMAEDNIKTPELSDKSGLTPQTLNQLARLEPGKSAQTSTVVKLCEAMDRSVSEFIAIGEE